jgi:nucleotide-binding universal stress UspA family protein
MSVAKVVVPLTGTKRDKQALAAAFAAAKPFNAHVVALFVRPDPRLAMPYIGAPISPQIVQEVIDSAEQINREAAKAVRHTLMQEAAAANVAIVAKPQKGESATCSFIEMEGYFPICVSAVARLSDLVVFGPIIDADMPDLADAFAETLVKTERPVLLAADVPATFPGKVVLAWDDSATAARALIGALPFLNKASSIVLLSCYYGQKPDLRDVEQYLTLHGVACTEEIVDPGKRDIGAVLLDRARALHAGLLVMGGYGHSRLGETIFGGVTQHVRWHATMPVLMVH